VARIEDFSVSIFLSGGLCLARASRCRLQSARSSRSRIAKQSLSGSGSLWRTKLTPQRIAAFPLLRPCSPHAGGDSVPSVVPSEKKVVALQRQP
jgi:hypothetical protein